MGNAAKRIQAYRLFNKGKEMIEECIVVPRGDLLNSQAALIHLGGVSLPVGRDNYWLAKTVGKLTKTMKHEMLAAQRESNRLIAELGDDVKNEEGVATGQKGIAQTNVDVMQQYHEAMEAFNAELLVIENVKPVSLTALEAAGVSLTISDQAAMGWLIEE